MVKSISTKKAVKCPILKQSDIKISAKNVDIHKKYFSCIDSKCKEFLDKDIKINKECLDKTKHLKLYDPKRMDCYTKRDLVKNMDNKRKCMETKCLSEFNKKNKISDAQKLSLSMVLDNSEFSSYAKEKKLLHEKEVQVYPVMEKMSKIFKKIDLIRITILKCKDKSEIKKLEKKMDRLFTMISKIEIKNK
jgi:hypothetical protein